MQTLGQHRVVHKPIVLPVNETVTKHKEEIKLCIPRPCTQTCWYRWNSTSLNTWSSTHTSISQETLRNSVEIPYYSNTVHISRRTIVALAKRVRMCDRYRRDPWLVFPSVPRCLQSTHQKTDRDWSYISFQAYSTTSTSLLLESCNPSFSSSITWSSSSTKVVLKAWVVKDVSRSVSISLNSSKPYMCTFYSILFYICLDSGSGAFRSLIPPTITASWFHWEKKCRLLNLWKSAPWLINLEADWCRLSWQNSYFSPSTPQSQSAVHHSHSDPFHTHQPSCPLTFAHEWITILIYTWSWFSCTVSSLSLMEAATVN